MSKHEIVHTIRQSEYSFANIRLKVMDGYPDTVLGCHVGMIGNIYVEPEFNSSNFFERARQVKSLRSSESLRTKMVDYLLDTLFEGFHKFGAYPKKSHIIISANWNNHSAARNDDAQYLWKTGDIIDMIMEHCERDPKKYGQAILSAPTENRAHVSTPPAWSRTLIWIPGFVQVLGEFSAAGVPKKEEPPKPKPPVEVVEDRGLVRPADSGRCDRPEVDTLGRVEPAEVREDREAVDGFQAIEGQEVQPIPCPAVEAGIRDGLELQEQAPTQVDQREAGNF